MTDTPPLDHAGTRVLVAESDPRMAALLHKGLRCHGFVPTLVDSSADVVALAASDPFPVVVLDLDDVEHGTMVALRRLRAAGCSAAIVVLAGRYGPAGAHEAEAAGADGFAPAPLRFALLAPLIGALLGRPVAGSGG